MHREEKIRDILAASLPQVILITFALMSGIVGYAGFLLVTAGPPDWRQIGQQVGFITITACAMGASNVMLANVLPQVFATLRRKDIDPKDSLEINVEKLSGTLRLNTVIAAALFEGAGFLGLIAYQLEGEPLGLGIAGVMVIAIAAKIPLPNRACAWVERQLQIIEDGADSRNSF